MTNLQIATFNCCGLTLETNRKALFHHLRLLNIHIYCLQEIHSTPNDESKWASEWGKNKAVFHSNTANNRNNGVAILLNHPDFELTTWHADQEGRIITADITIQSQKFHLVNIYAPQCNFSIHNNLFHLVSPLVDECCQQQHLHREPRLFLKPRRKYSLVPTLLHRRIVWESPPLRIQAVAFPSA